MFSASGVVAIEVSKRVDGGDAELADNWKLLAGRELLGIQGARVCCNAHRLCVKTLCRQNGEGCQQDMLINASKL